MHKAIVANLHKTGTLTIGRPKVTDVVPAALAGWIGMVPGLLINEAGGLAVIANGLRLLKR